MAKNIERARTARDSSSFEDGYSRFLRGGANGYAAFDARTRTGGGKPVKYVGGGFTGKGYIPPATTETTARKIEVGYAEALPVERPRPSVKSQPKRKKAEKAAVAAEVKMPKRVYIKAKSGVHLMSVPTFLIVASMFIGSITFALTYAVEAGDNTKYKILTTQLNDAVQANHELENESSLSDNLADVYEWAVAAGMHEPYDHQKVYVNIPEQTYVTQYDDNESTPVEFGLSALFEPVLKKNAENK